MHTPVLLKKSIKFLKIKKNGIYIDATFGCGGHSKKILKKLGSQGKLYVIDKDPESIKIAKKIKDSRIKIIKGSFSQIYKYCTKYKILRKINGIILDLGISSLQLNNSKRGFSFKKDGPLDMRMNQKKGITASKWIMNATEKKISEVLKKYGEERYSKKIASNITKYKKKKKIKRTQQLSKIIKKSLPYQKKHPSRRSFQAIRIYLNNELYELKKFLKNILKILKPKGRLCIISFHSLEDRIIKNFMFKHSRKIPNFPSSIPFTEKELIKLNKKKCKLKIYKKIFPTKKEIFNNLRSRSAILRIAEFKKI
ncbi:MAG: 16S rRNA (cytosine(1402)-N(4))-methyltransferase RsmH [Buchnera aphidicola (Periphyllus aceris)]|nr:16S rRNA (cytosine(1402)-N(4))-methyltransferase RsmH [Buchnera aphidicola (Periphyllus aceris)]